MAESAYRLSTQCGAPTLKYRCGGSTGIDKKGLGYGGREPAYALVLRPESYFTLPVSRLSRAEDLDTGTWNLAAANLKFANDRNDSTPPGSRNPRKMRLTREIRMLRGNIPDCLNEIRVMAHLAHKHVMVNHIQK